MEIVKPDRIAYHESCKRVQAMGLLRPGEVPPLPSKPPRHDDEVLAVRFFRKLLTEAALENLSLPRTFFGRSEIRGVSFQNTDLSESTANWNDFIEVNFSEADLSRVDFRASELERVNFSGAVLRGADLRNTGLRHCTFTDADMTGAKLQRTTGMGLTLSEAQKSVIEWFMFPGPTPEGG